MSEREDLVLAYRILAAHGVVDARRFKSEVQQCSIDGMAE